MKSLFKKKSKNKNIASQIYTPENTISSFIELPHGMEPMEAIWHTSSIALDTEQICFVYTLENDGVYFIAAPASSFLGKENSSSPLAAALPGNEFHQGDGAYICSVKSNLFAVAIKGESKLSCFIGDKDSVLQFAGEANQFWVEASTTKWFSLTQYKQENTIKLLKTISIVSFVFMLLMSAITVGFNLKTENHVAEIKRIQNKMIIEDKKNIIKMNANSQNNQINKLLKKYSDLSSSIIKLNGRMTSFEYKGNIIKYTAELPPSTTDFKFFGDNVSPIVKSDVIIVEKEESI